MHVLKIGHVPEKSIKAKLIWKHQRISHLLAHISKRITFNLLYVNSLMVQSIGR
jgi:hypothetical protein